MPRGRRTLHLRRQEIDLRRRKPSLRVLRGSFHAPRKVLTKQSPGRIIDGRRTTMSRRVSALSSGVTLLIVSFFDFYVTLRYSPNLSQEANPIVYLLGQGLAGLIVGNVLIIAPLLFLLYRYGTSPNISEQNHAKDKWEYLSYSIFSQYYPKNTFFKNVLLYFTRPKNMRNYLNFFGYFATWFLIGCRIGAIFSWIAICEFNWQSFTIIRSHIKIFGAPTFELIVGGIVAYRMILYYINNEYRLANSVSESSHP